MEDGKEAVMPGGDQSGPRGEGSQTGRQAGYCSGSDAPGYTQSGFDRMNFRHRNLRRFGCRFAPAVVEDDDERKSLLQELKDLKDKISNLQQKVDEISK